MTLNFLSMVLKQYFQQSWFILLMALVMSCATISVASAKTMHINMIVPQLNADCMQQSKQQVDHLQHQKQSTQETTQTTHQHCDDVKNTETDCLDCNFNACHSLMSWLHLTESEQPNPLFVSSSTKTTLPYNAQHLHGFWQEILRPPKA